MEKGVWFALLGLLSVAAGFADHGQGESLADRRLASILEDEKALVEAAAQGAEADELLALAGDVARRYEGFLRENPDHLYGWILCGKFLRSIGADDRAFAAFRKADSLSPGLAVVQSHLGLILADEGAFRPALAHLLRAVEIEPAEPAYRHDLGEFLTRFGPALEEDGVLESGRSGRLALEAFGEAFHLEPDNFERGWRWAEMFADLPDTDWEAAAAAWEEVHAAAGSLPEKEASRLQIARAWIEAGDSDRAEPWLDPVETPALADTWRALKHRLGDAP
ncbi:MAG: hypothetical protein ACLFRP_05510 [Puniceicoccaceae bacterium]